MLYSLGNINISALNSYCKNLVTTETIVTSERFMHILQKHPQDIELFQKYGKLCVEEPDVVIEDIEHEGTIFMVKKLQETNLNVVVRLILQGEDTSRKTLL